MRAHWSSTLGQRGVALALVFICACTVTRLAQTPYQRGELLYERHCIGCHQFHAEGDDFRAVPDLAGQNPIYLTRQIGHLALGERPGAQMHWALQRFPMDRAEDRAALVAYLSQLAHTRNPKVGSARAQSIGEVLYRERCLRCHGKDAGGLAEGAIPSIRNQHASYLRNRLRGLGHHDDPAIDSAMTRVIEPLSDQQIVALAAYLAAL